MPICMKCGDIIGKGHVCQKCQVQFSEELEAKGRKKAYVLTAIGVLGAVFIYRKLPAGSVSKVFSDASSTRHEVIPAITGLLETVKEPASMIDVQFRMIFAAIVFALVGAFALLTVARRGF